MKPYQIVILSFVVGALLMFVGIWGIGIYKKAKAFDKAVQQYNEQQKNLQTSPVK